MIRKVDFKDSDYVVTLFGRESGKFAGIAKGARKLDSKFGGRFDLLNLVEVVFYQGSGLSFISEAGVIENWDGLRDSGDSIDTGLRCARALNKLLEDGQREQGVFVVMERTLASLDGGSRPPVVELGFYLKVFWELGYRPQLEKCSICGKPVEGEGSLEFDPRAGGVIGDDCSRGEGIPISGGLRKVLLKLSSSSQRSVGRLKVSEDQLARGFSLLKKFAQFHFDQEVIPEWSTSPEEAEYGPGSATT